MSKQSTYSLSDVLTSLQILHSYTLRADTDTATILAHIAQLRVYVLAEENLKQGMMEQHAQTIEQYEAQLAAIQKRMIN